MPKVLGGCFGGGVFDYLADGGLEGVQEMVSFLSPVVWMGFAGVRIDGWGVIWSVDILICD